MSELTDWVDARLRELSQWETTSREVRYGERHYVIRNCAVCGNPTEQRKGLLPVKLYCGIRCAKNAAQKRRRLRGAALLLALFMAAPSLATITSSPVDLGTAGLTVTVGLRHWQESSPNSWPTASTAGVTVEDLGSGLYVVHGLPLATGTDKYAVTVAAGGVSLATYSYGAQPGTQLVWRQELDLPSPPLQFVVGDTYGSLQLVVTRRLPAAACDPGTTAEVTAAEAGSNAALFSDQAATISNCQLDQTTGSYGATITYALQAADLDTIGKFVVQARICYSPSSCQTLPSSTAWRFEVVKRVGG